MAKNKFMGLYHEHAYQKETGELLEDKLFFVVNCTNVSGELIEKFEGGRNTWLTTAQMKKKKVFNSYQIELDVSKGKHRFIEHIDTYSKQEF